MVRVARMALEYRYAFGTDVVIDLIGYRRHGHSEVEDPTTTQPLLYAKIEKTPELWQSYSRGIGADLEDVQRQVAAIRAGFELEQEKAKAAAHKPVLRELPPYWTPYDGVPYDHFQLVDSAVSRGGAGRGGAPHDERARRVLRAPQAAEPPPAARARWATASARRTGAPPKCSRSARWPTRGCASA